MRFAIRRPRTSRGAGNKSVNSRLIHTIFKGGAFRSEATIIENGAAVQEEMELKECKLKVPRTVDYNNVNINISHGS